MLGYEPDRQTVTGYDAELIENLQTLKICRDAYWKIAGEQMGLGKPWEPDWKEYHRHWSYAVRDVPCAMQSGPCSTQMYRSKPSPPADST